MEVLDEDQISLARLLRGSFSEALVHFSVGGPVVQVEVCLLYTSDAADE